MNDLESAVRAVQAGDTDAFRVLVVRYGDMVRRAAMSVRSDHELAEDVVQEAFLEAYRCIGSLRAPVAFPSWLKVIAVRQARRLAPTHSHISLDDIAEQERPDSNPGAALEGREQLQRLRAAILRLSDRQQAVAVLHYLQGFTQTQVAAALGLPIATVKKRLYDVRLKLKEILTMNSDSSPDRRDDPEATMGLIRLLQAIESERVEEIQEILDRQPQLARARVRDRHPNGETLLHRAMPEYMQPETETRLAIAALLLAAGADVREPGWGMHFSDEPPLMSAAHRGQPKMVKLLLSHGADPEVGVAKDWWSGAICRPIDTAAVHGSAAVVEALMDGGARYSLAHPVLCGLVERARIMLRADPESVNRVAEGALPLHHAVTWQYHPAIIDLLLEYGAEPNARDAMGRSALHVALRGADGRSAASRLIKAGAEVDVFSAAGIPDVDRLRLLLSQQPELANAQQSDGATPITYAVASGESEPVKTLLASGADPDPNCPGTYRYWYADRPLTIAAQAGFAQTVRLLLDAGAAPSGLPLPKAAFGGFQEVINMLLDAAANVHSRDNFGRSALDWAASMDRPEIAEILLSRGFDPANHGEGGQTALHLAASDNRAAVAKVLLAHGSPADLADDLGQTPLDVAESSGSDAVAVLLRGSTKSISSE